MTNEERLKEIEQRFAYIETGELSRLGIETDILWLIQRVRELELATQQALDWWDFKPEEFLAKYGGYEVGNKKICAAIRKALKGEEAISHEAGG